MKSAILDMGEKYYTYLGKIFQAIENQQANYNWLISDCECYPHDEELYRLFSQEYTWISGDQLTEIINKADFQFVWGVLSGFSKEVALEEVLKYDLPYADGNAAFWADNVSIQHPLANIEIVAWDSTLTLFLSKDDCLIEKFMDAFPLSKDLSAQNKKENAEVSHIEKLMISELNKRSINIDKDLLYKKHLIWNKLYYMQDTLVEDKDILSCIYDTLRLK